ncbi:hypothetical protein ME782_14100 [Lactobacillus delbrueckii]|nr:hypothetical protein ME782_14100 [Lactobacillus delbrueckii]
MKVLKLQPLKNVMLTNNTLAKNWKKDKFYYVGGEKTWHFNAELNRHLFTLVCER